MTTEADLREALVEAMRQRMERHDVQDSAIIGMFMTLAESLTEAIMEGPLIPLLRAREAAERERDDLKRALANALAAQAGVAEAVSEATAERSAALATNAALTERVKRLEETLANYRSAASTHVTMEGVEYRGVSISAYRQAWSADHSALNPEPSRE